MCFIKAKGILILLAILSSMNVNAQTNNDELAIKWEEWKIKFQRVYPSSEEETVRFNIWKESYKKIEEYNQMRISKGLGIGYELNNFSDRTNEEFFGASGKDTIDETKQDEIIVEDPSIPLGVDPREVLLDEDLPGRHATAIDHDQGHEDDL